jgi:RIO-like serine/threonine protein kinase
MLAGLLDRCANQYLKVSEEFYVHGTVHPYNIVLINNQRDAAMFYLVY